MSNTRLSLGPVFAYEWITSSRRWQSYAIRSGFVAALLCALLVVRTSTWAPTGTKLRALARMAELFFLALSGTQLALVLLAAPIATAGAICLDQTRGTLSHMLMTDLSDSEIVLGKLAARLIPVLGLLACVLPVMELLALLGGVDPTALLGGFAVSLGVAVLGCSLAMFFSLWVEKTHEALMGTYAVWALWLLARPISDLVATRTGSVWVKPARTVDPFFLALAPYWWPTSVVFSDYMWFLGATVSLSAVLTAVMVLRLRSICLREKVPKRPRRRPSNRIRDAWRSGFERIPWLNPSLDGNPVLWREWHRSTPSRWSRLIMGLFGGLSVVCSVIVILGPGGAAGAWVNGLQVSIGLLLLSVAATSSLAEERAHGSLDLLLSTPLSARQIVLGKWLGAYRMVPLLAIMPALVIGCAALAANWTRGWVFLLMIAYVLAAGAAITSLGVAMATVFSRQGRAVGVTVTLYVFIAAGWLILTTMVVAGPRQGLDMASPFFWAGELTFEVSSPRSLDLSVGWAIIWTLACVWAGVQLLQFTLDHFDRRLGRIEQSDTRPAGPTRLARALQKVYLSVAVALGFFALSAAWAPAAIACQFTLGLLLLAVTAVVSSPEAEKAAEPGDAGTLGNPVSRSIFACWAAAYRWVVPVIAPSFVLLLLHAQGGRYLIQSILLVFYMLSVGAAFVSLGVAIAVWTRRKAGAIALVIFSWALLNTIWVTFAGDLRGELPWLELVLGMGSPFLGVWSLGMATIGSHGGHEAAVACGFLWSAVYAVAAVLLLRRAMVTLDPSSGLKKAARAWSLALWSTVAQHSS